jgi:hypothetical protein
LLLLLTASYPALAYSDIGLLKNQKTAGFFALLPTDSADFSPGFVYHQKQNDSFALEFSGVNYYKIYPFMKNVVKLRADGQYKLLKIDSTTVTVVVGPTLYYAAGVGAGLAVNLGGILSAKILDNLAVALTATTTIFKDGTGCDLSSMIYFVPGWLKNTEFYGGGRLEAAMVGFPISGTSSSKLNNYLCAGVRIGL